MNHILNKRKILHLDMDAFYASVEILDNPQLKNLPVIVGGNPESRSVVAAASYKAREFGIRSAMSCSQAKRLCPNAIFIRPNFNRYKEISNKIHKIISQYTDLIQPLSLDEAWLDVTENKKGMKSATQLAEKLKAQVFHETGLTCSIGVSYNKMLAKIASDENKPNGIFVVTPKNAGIFLANLKIKKIPGIGPVTQKKLHQMKIFLGSDLLKLSLEELNKNMGKFGLDIYERIRGIDHRPVKIDKEVKSISVEDTFEKDYLYSEELLNKISLLIDKLIFRMNKKNLSGYTFTLKVKFSDFHLITRSMTFKNK